MADCSNRQQPAHRLSGGFWAAEARMKTGEWDGAVQSVLGGPMKGVSECAVLTIALAALAQPVLARTYLNCSARKVVFISAPTGDTSSAREEDLGFWVDDEAKTLAFLDNTPLTVTRLDRFWISAGRDGIFYEFDRQDGTLSYASSTTKDGVSTTIVGLWVLVSPWVLSFADTTAMWVHIVIGIVVAVVAAIELWMMHHGGRLIASR
jgi:SPW repeat